MTSSTTHGNGTMATRRHSVKLSGAGGDRRLRLSVCAFLLGAVMIAAGCSDDPETTQATGATEPSMEEPAKEASSRPGPPARWQDRLLRDEPVPVVVDPDQVDLGVVNRFDEHKITATLTNTSDETLRIATSLADCGCTAIDMAGEFLGPGESIELQASFMATERTGDRSAIIQVVFEGYSDPLRIPVRAFVAE